MQKNKKSGHVRKNINRIVSLICSAMMLMSTVQLSMPAAVYAEAATEAPVSQCRASDYYHWRCVSYVRLFSEKVKNSDR